MKKYIILFFIIILSASVQAQKIDIPSAFLIEPVKSHIKSMKVFYSSDNNEFLCYEAKYDSSGRFTKQQYWQQNSGYAYLNKMVDYTYQSVYKRSYIRMIGEAEQKVNQQLDAMNNVISSTVYEGKKIDSYLYYTYLGKTLKGYYWLNSKKDTMVYYQYSFDKDTMLVSGTDFLNYYRGMGEYSPSFFKKSVERYGDSLIMIMKHYKVDQLQSTEYFYRVYKKGKLIKEYIPTHDGPVANVGNPTRKIITYTYNDKGLPLTMKEDMIEYSEITSWKMFRAEYEYY